MRPRARRAGQTAAALTAVAILLAGCAGGDPLVVQPDARPSGVDVDTAAPAPPSSEPAAAGLPAPTETVEVEGTSALHLAVGDCFQNPSASGDAGSGDTEPGALVAAVEVVPCARPHDNEVYAVVAVSGERFPGPDALLAQAEGCRAPFADYVGVAYEESDYIAYPVLPTAASWDAGDRAVVCVLRGSARLVGSARDTAS